MQLWTREEETLLCECWVEVSENNGIRANRSDDSFWWQITDDFNKATHLGDCSEHMTMGKWASDKYGYIKNHMKTVKNKQARTRESEEYQKKPKNQSRSQKSQASVKISQEKSKSVKDVFPRDSLAQDQAQATSIMKKAQIYVGFTLNSLTKEAQAVTSRNDSLAILECTQYDQTAINHLEMIRRLKG
ncbi:hypothetical protein Tco_1293712 [Tanacetum coccineum]